MRNLKKLAFVFTSILIIALAIFIPIQFLDFINPFSEQKPTPPKKPEPQIVKIAAFGDTMMHGPQIKSGTKPDGSYQFDHFFKEVKSYLSLADLTIGNFETTLAGPEKGYKGYPMFNAPDEIVDALKNAGVDLVSTANNHSMDTGSEGVKRTYQVLKQKGILPVGTAPSADEKKPTIVKKKGITFAFLAYTESTNGLPVPQDKPYLVNKIDPEKIAQDIKESKAQGAEFVIVSLHFGIEYQRKPNEQQIEIANQVLQDGADVILGSHPHVLQHMEKVKVAGKEKLIIYSMGNFVSNQSDPYTDEGIVLYFDVEKNPETKQVTLKDTSFLPTYVHKYQDNGKLNYVIIPTETETPNKEYPYPNFGSMKWKQAWTNTIELMKEKGTFPTFSMQSN